MKVKIELDAVAPTVLEATLLEKMMTDLGYKEVKVFFNDELVSYNN